MWISLAMSSKECVTNLDGCSYVLHQNRNLPHSKTAGVRAFYKASQDSKTHNETNTAAGWLEWVERQPLTVAPGFTPPCNHLLHSGVLEQDTYFNHPQKCCPDNEPDLWPGKCPIEGSITYFIITRFLEMRYRCGHMVAGGAEGVC